ncbi:hypothetical protein EZ428_09300 [Pedobacter frigiditerrae]|uniref:Uncharacterized protein n=1 Tax=Pedobacter frigiditerrae TaxID=2530452 RepID=A0A4R0MYF1_9SPHI|nr:hypothetical protein [Pedobacter frigiditerrae]TCC91933.1 hypothetical protein EZ428_09300 [Pedobacter frigiditerrae]
MKELELLLEELKEALKQKEQAIELREEPSSANTTSLINNRKADIEGFEKAISLVTKDPYSKNIIIDNFKIEVKKIKERIEEIR